MHAIPTYRRPALFLNGHIETIYPAAFRRVNIQVPIPERISTLDQDFIDLDWYRQESDKLVIVCHGLEGNNKRAYILGMVRAFLLSGFDALTWNYRGCGTEMNKQVRFYHSGATDDLDWVVQHAVNQNRYEQICVIGFSLGGNLLLKYLGEQHQSTQYITKAVAISAPVDLAGSCNALATPANWLYVHRFLKSLKAKVSTKAKLMTLPIETNLSHIKTLRHFDDVVTAPLHGFKDAAEYYTRNSSLTFLPHIQRRALLISAYNDPFLSPECFPVNFNNQALKVIYTKHGGHVGYTSFNGKKLYWSEMQALNFCFQD